MVGRRRLWRCSFSCRRCSSSRAGFPHLRFVREKWIAPEETESQASFSRKRVLRTFSTDSRRALPCLFKKHSAPATRRSPRPSRALLQRLSFARRGIRKGTSARCLQRFPRRTDMIFLTGKRQSNILYFSWVRPEDFVCMLQI